ncbi:4-hydroxy-tetrahydrodipicolinate reductase [Spiribacter sp. C176]|uniref:4-hydroxy-tetrahydrodipicolinate reductase n=1 Tax=Spiribacter salilacus TaxID=2664894 RepID=A0A6N7QL43_9GAMM|nr:4-hydroxy-tetrahydrodipicolinate reductase [Spiribacter salilacus]MRH77196.1 4-hydroxy-tetrahydrodipicolinate reductase [Spiribacter salilacus]
MTRIGILGANGRMGRSLIGLIAASDDLVLSGAGLRAGHSLVGQDAGEALGLGRTLGVPLQDSAYAVAQHSDVVIDFTLPAALEENLAAAERTATPMVIGTTGLDDRCLAALDATAMKLPIVFAANYSSGITLLLRLAAIAAGALSADYDVAISEAHHRYKKDAPSGTALRLGEVVAKARDIEALDSSAFQSIRAGDIVGEHTVLLAAEGERIELTHRASSRDTFARGALRAAQWLLKQQTPGRYDMEDVLGLRGVG